MTSSIPPVARMFPFLLFIRAAQRTMPTCASYAYTRDIPPLSNLLPSAVVVDFADALFNISVKDCCEGSTSSVVDKLAVVGSQPYIQPSYVPSVTLIFDLAMVSVSRLYKGRLSSTVAPVSGEQFQQSKSRRKDVVVWGFFFFLIMGFFFFFLSV